jgi:hypothetical protein
MFIQPYLLEDVDTKLCFPIGVNTETNQVVLADLIVKYTRGISRWPVRGLFLNPGQVKKGERLSLYKDAAFTIGGLTEYKIYEIIPVSKQKPPKPKPNYYERRLLCYNQEFAVLFTELDQISRKLFGTLEEAQEFQKLRKESKLVYFQNKKLKIL